MLPKQIALQIPADVGHLRLARALLRSAASGWPLDRIDDLSLAMDEAAALLIEIADDQPLDVGIEALPNELAVTMSCPTAVEWPPPTFPDSLDDVFFRGLVDTADLRRSDEKALIVLRVAR